MLKLSTIVAALALFASSAHALTLQAYTTASQPELVSGIPENTNRVVVMSLPIADVQVGDIISVAAEMQATNPTNQWALFTTSVILASSPTATTGTALTEENGENFNPVSGSCWMGRCDVYHLVASKPGGIVATKAMAAGYVNFLASSATSPSQTSWSIRVDKGYGRIFAMKFRQ
jgi:hypothetical protein